MRILTEKGNLTRSVQETIVLDFVQETDTGTLLALFHRQVEDLQWQLEQQNSAS